ncbi:MAG: hypothetical protein GXO47_15045 [Chlorobi bacterium]|nr:hypothetical protein [Chlorobiota bacterium]
MRNILIIILITISQFAFANFGGYIKQDSEGAGSLYLCADNSTIRLINESIDIDLNQRVSFKARFTFYNDSETDQTITLGFPQYSYWDVPYGNKGYQPGKYYPLKADFAVNGENSEFDKTLFSIRLDSYDGVKLYTSNEMRDKLIEYAEMHEAESPPSMPILIWELKELNFKSNDTVVVEIEFVRPWFYKDESWSNKIETDGIKSFDYIFETGKTWKDSTIENFSCKITFPDDAIEHINFNRKDFQKLSSNEILIEKQNWKPSSSENLKIEWYSTYQISSFNYDMLYYSTYCWHHATDGSRKTAWCFKEKDLNEKPLFIKKINYPINKEHVKIQSKEFDNPIYVTKISIINGFAKDSKTFSTNSRVKTIELIINDTTQIITLKDSSTKQTFDLIEKADIGQGILFKIINYYNGSKYDDICISEIEFE